MSHLELMIVMMGLLSLTHFISRFSHVCLCVFVSAEHWDCIFYCALTALWIQKCHIPPAVWSVLVI